MAENLQYDLEGMGLSLQWKQHQSAKSSTQDIIPGVPRCFCKAGLKSHLLFHLKRFELELIKNRRVSHMLTDSPLPSLVISYKYMKKGKSNNKAAKKLSINHLKAH